MSSVHALGNAVPVAETTADTSPAKNVLTVRHIVDVRTALRLAIEHGHMKYQFEHIASLTKLLKHELAITLLGHDIGIIDHDYGNGVKARIRSASGSCSEPLSPSV